MSFGENVVKLKVRQTNWLSCPLSCRKPLSLKYFLEFEKLRFSFFGTLLYEPSFDSTELKKSFGEIMINRLPVRKLRCILQRRNWFLGGISLNGGRSDLVLEKDFESVSLADFGISESLDYWGAILFTLFDSVVQQFPPYSFRYPGYSKSSEIWSQRHWRTLSEDLGKA